MNNNDFFKAQVWYPILEKYTFPTKFVKLPQEAIEMLATRKIDLASPVSLKVMELLKDPMDKTHGHCFISTDNCSLTDTERFATKRGAIHSPASAWRYLCESKKVALEARKGEVTNICIKPYRNLTRAREFRLFIDNGQLVGASQYWMIRHYRRLVGIKDLYFQKMQDFVKEVAPLIPLEKYTLDIYFKSSLDIFIVDVNEWGAPTCPKLFNWDYDFTKSTPELRLIKAPSKIKGDVNVSF